MSILSSVKKAFGFPDEYEEYENESADSVAEDDTTEDSDRHGNEANAPAEPVSVPDVPDPTALSGEIFDAVIELFNGIQPAFVKECLSVEKERGYIMEHIDNSVRRRIEAEISAARSRGEALWQQERQRLSADLDKIRTEYNQLKQQREEFQSAQLSAARQKRALNERIHDLESKITGLEAEKEQFQLENRSMLNKLRVAGVRSSGNADAEAEIQRLAEENLKHQDTIAKLNGDLETAGKHASELEARIMQLETEAMERSEEEKAAMSSIEEQLKQFEALQSAKDARIKELKEANQRLGGETAELKSTVNEREATIKSLRNTIEENLVSHASAVAELKAEIERAKAPKPGNASESKPQKQAKKPKETYKPSHSVPEAETEKTEEKRPAEKEVKISAIDELMESTDWFVAPDPTPLKKDPEVEEAFGYKEPVKKTSRDDDKQLSLW